MQIEGQLVMVIVAVTAVAAMGCGGTGSSACDVAVSAHPESLFPLAGAHSCATCESCHVPRLGTDDRANVSCIDCHSHARATSDAQHGEVNQYWWSDAAPGSCRACHPGGR